MLNLHNYLLSKMIEQKYIDPNVTKEFYTIYFSHYKTITKTTKFCDSDPFGDEFLENIDELFQ